MNFNDYSKLLNTEQNNDNTEKIATAYATAKILGYTKSITDFKDEFIKYYNDAISELEK
jgi:hypothetical protein